ncbi:HEAT repeat domain-containing protein [Lederbergia wuyishanensis]|uniref:HEAT repeat domain-containing protein n=1 Tax=Lederbergia wuyishanensis TaxID=1347903 RepID=A0ABU0D5W0_9BACI|nr:hypothetical protein [Lederbergia wuyishanensis]MCJ8008379.1 hypothetical protein [Lederbergia wuyishanensis]MDQ0343793.1 hypothetical protein [Lederbergia wuyishanensis]
MNTMILLYLILIIAAAQLLILCYLLIRKYKNNKRQLYVKKTYETLMPIYLEYIMASPEQDIEEIVRRDDDLAIVEKILIDYLRNVNRNEDVIRIQHLAAALLTEKYTKALRSRQWSTRMNTLSLIELFKLKIFILPLLEKLNTSNKLDEEIVQTMKTVASLQELGLINFLVKKTEIPERVLFDILVRYEVKHIDSIINMISNSHDERILRALIQVISNHHYQNGFPFVRRHLLSKDGETRLRVLQAFEEMNQMVDPSEITPFLSSTIWQERMLAVKICAKLKLNRFQPFLNQLIGDQVWWVRYYSGQAISQLQDGELLLQYIAEQHRDRYARDMAKQWMSTMMGGTM